MSKVLSFNQMADANDAQYTLVSAWGGDVRLSTVDAGTMLAFVESNEDPEKKRIAGLVLLAKSVVDEAGTHLSPDQEGPFIEMLKKKNAVTVNALVGAVLKLNGIDSAANRAAKNASGEAGSDASPIV